MLKDSSGQWNEITWNRKMFKIKTLDPKAMTSFNFQKRFLPRAKNFQVSNRFKKFKICLQLIHSNKDLRV